MIQVLTVTDGTLGGWLTDFVADAERLLWGGNVLDTYFPPAWNTLLNYTAILAAILATIYGTKIAIETMAQGKRLDVTALFRPFAVALVLANWWSITYGLFWLVKPVEQMFQVTYEWAADELEVLRQKRNTLSYTLSNKVMQVDVEAQVAHKLTDAAMQTRREREDNPEEDANMTQAYAESGFHTIVHDWSTQDSLHVTGGGPELPVEQVTGDARFFNLVERAILWLGECMWTVALYAVFMTKYLFLWVLIAFGPLWFAASILDVWKDKWADWLGRYIAVNFYGVCAYIALYFGMILMMGSVGADVERMQAILNSEGGVHSYIVFLHTSGVGSALMSIITYLVVAAVLPITFELATMVVPSDAGRGAAAFFNGWMQFVRGKITQTKRAVTTAVVAVVTGDITAAAETNRRMADADGATDGVLASDGTAVPLPDGPDADADNRGNNADGRREDGNGGEDERKEDDDKYSHLSSEEEEWCRQQDEEEEEMKQPEPQDFDDPDIRLALMADNANRTADRMTYEALRGPKAKRAAEDIMAEARDMRHQMKADGLGIGERYRQIREERYRENLFLLRVVKGGLFEYTAKGKRDWGQMGRKRYTEKFKPVLTTFNAVRGKDEQAAEYRRFLERNGLYKYAVRNEIYMRILSLIKPTTKLQMRLCEATRRKLVETDATISCRCRELLAQRDIHVDTQGKPLRLTYPYLYWREDTGVEDWKDANRAGARFTDKGFVWFMNRYSQPQEAEEMEVMLDVMEVKVRAGEMKDFILERQLKARDDNERELWAVMGKEYTLFRRIKRRIRRINQELRSRQAGNGGNNDNK